MKFRLHKGGFNESMATTREFVDVEELRHFIIEDFGEYIHRLDFEYIGLDNRNGWHTYYVKTVFDGMEGSVILGMSDANPNESVDLVAILRNMNETIEFAQYDVNPAGPASEFMLNRSREEVIGDMKNLKDQFSSLLMVLKVNIQEI